MKLITEIDRETDQNGVVWRMGLFECNNCGKRVKKRMVNGKRDTSCTRSCSGYHPAITDDDRLAVVYYFLNNEENSSRIIAKKTGMPQNRVDRILNDHLSGKNRVEWVEIESRINFEQDKQTA